MYLVGYSIRQRQGSGLEQLPPTSGTAAPGKKLESDSAQVVWNRTNSSFPSERACKSLRDEDSDGFSGTKSKDQSLLMWTSVVQLRNVPVYNELTGVADCFQQLENILVALEKLPSHHQYSDPSYASESRTRFLFCSSESTIRSWFSNLWKARCVKKIPVKELLMSRE